MPRRQARACGHLRRFLWKHVKAMFIPQKCPGHRHRHCHHHQHHPHPHPHPNLKPWRYYCTEQKDTKSNIIYSSRDIISTSVSIASCLRSGHTNQIYGSTLSWRRRCQSSNDDVMRDRLANAVKHAKNMLAWQENWLCYSLATSDLHIDKKHEKHITSRALRCKEWWQLRDSEVSFLQKECQ